MTGGADFKQIQKAYLRVFLALIVLTALTVAVSTIHFGHDMHIVLGVLIAMAKAALVIAIFMHLKFDNRRLRYFIYIPVFFFITFVFALTVIGL